jgi:hypothetical protein
MISLKEGIVTKILTTEKDKTEVEVEVEGEKGIAVNYDSLTGQLAVGDKVVVNAVGIDLALGSGGRYFVLWNFSTKRIKLTGNGHIVKLRYTPLQLKCCCVEEEASPYHELFKKNLKLLGMPVLIGALHSHLPPVVLSLKKLKSDLNIVYLMTDGAALPLSLSNHVLKLKERNLLKTTITIGNAFGGDIEAINIFSGLIAARYVASADIALVCIGPGIVGTGTVVGHGGMEQGEVINAVASLGGYPVLIPRISFADKRERHYGLSHHTLSALEIAALASCTVVLPEMEREKLALVRGQLFSLKNKDKHKIVVRDGEIALKALAEAKYQVTTMGRNPVEEPEFFKAAGAAASYAYEYWRRWRDKTGSDKLNV